MQKLVVSTTFDAYPDGRLDRFDAGDEIAIAEAFSFDPVTGVCDAVTGEFAALIEAKGLGMISPPTPAPKPAAPVAPPAAPIDALSILNQG